MGIIMDMLTEKGIEISRLEDGHFYDHMMPIIINLPSDQYNALCIEIKEQINNLIYQITKNVVDGNDLLDLTRIINNL